MKYFIKKALPSLVVLLLLLAPVFFVQAQLILDPPSGEQPSAKLKNPISQDSIQEFIYDLLTGVIKIGIPLVVLAILYSGFLFVTALGNTEKLNNAKSALMWSLIGGAVLLGSWALAELLIDTVETIENETGMAPIYLVEVKKELL